MVCAKQIKGGGLTTSLFQESIANKVHDSYILPDVTAQGQSICTSFKYEIKIYESLSTNRLGVLKGYGHEGSLSDSRDLCNFY
ncbi:hypothetical protein L1049_008601 [Liquidambar formosana]|uniref:Uncharacterized protein n=1 Tax=Liquidambar formosana TaxID=63359 RepID=A0AAP0SA29_LIQFO